jgi:hypothetical protein
MNRVFRIVVACVFAAVIAFDLSVGKALALGQFSRTCQGSVVNGSTLSAKCQTTSGNFVPSSINLNPYIENVDGVLKWQSGNFIETCRSTALTGPSIMSAQCKTRAQQWVSTKINLDEHIANINGKLTYE